MRYIFFTFSFIFFSVKESFFSKKNFQYKTFFPQKNNFSANNIYFVKNTNIFSKIFFFLLSFAINEQPQNPTTWIKYCLLLELDLMNFRTHKNTDKDKN